MDMTVTINHTLTRKYGNGLVYANAVCADNNEMITATLEYIIKAASIAGYKIVNSHEILPYLSKQVEFK